MQKLLIPIPQCLITAGYLNTAYRNKFGFAHYGQDMISLKQDRKFFASGTGKVLLAGMDSLLGNILIVQYPQVYNSQTQKTADLVLRYAHMDQISVKVGDTVTPGVLLGLYGNTGRYSAGAHLHVEADYDTKFFAYSATVGKSGTLIKAGNVQSMCCPSNLLFVKSNSPENQICQRSQASFGGIPFVREDELPLPLPRAEASK